MEEPLRGVRLGELPVDLARLLDPDLRLPQGTTFVPAPPPAGLPPRRALAYAGLCAAASITFAGFLPWSAPAAWPPIAVGIGSGAAGVGYALRGLGLHRSWQRARRLGAWRGAGTFFTRGGVLSVGGGRATWVPSEAVRRLDPRRPAVTYVDHGELREIALEAATGPSRAYLVDLAGQWVRRHAGHPPADGISHRSRPPFGAAPVAGTTGTPSHQ